MMRLGMDLFVVSMSYRLHGTMLIESEKVIKF